eukprot:TRINITY_DN7084_c0_g1_i1.p1 TRINITY_DN7084_c0_g1~~TRINITY_DN7084_c0_g1_i1.p1  ORF type:complete len:442 (+),score=40.66 TRINITY_DN7084_c0_g1_i1:45-1370(+)
MPRLLPRHWPVVQLFLLLACDPIVATSETCVANRAQCSGNGCPLPDHTFQCECFNTAVLGHWTDANCSSCIVGWAGPLCTEAVGIVRLIFSPTVQSWGLENILNLVNTIATITAVSADCIDVVSTPSSAGAALFPAVDFHFLGTEPEGPIAPLAADLRIAGPLSAKLGILALLVQSNPPYFVFSPALSSQGLVPSVPTWPSGTVPGRVVIASPHTQRSPSVPPSSSQSRLPPKAGHLLWLLLVPLAVAIALLFLRWRMRRKKALIQRRFSTLYTRPALYSRESSHSPTSQFGKESLVQLSEEAQRPQIPDVLPDYPRAHKFSFEYAPGSVPEPALPDSPLAVPVRSPAIKSVAFALDTLETGRLVDRRQSAFVPEAAVPADEVAEAEERYVTFAFNVSGVPDNQGSIERPKTPGPATFDWPCDSSGSSTREKMKDGDDYEH